MTKTASGLSPAQLNHARKALERTSDFADIVGIRDLAVAAETFARTALDDEAVREAVDVKLEAQRKAGQALTKMARTSERAKGNPRPPGSKSPIPVTLADLGVTKNQSSLWQRQGAMKTAEWTAHKEQAFNKIGRVFRQFFGNGQHTPPPPLPKGTFDVILADPPWEYNFAETDSRKIENQYPTMNADEIAALKPPTAPNAVLYLWATAPKLPEALDVIDGWGFTYVTNLVWVKDKIGMGYWARGRHELLLVATKGTPGVPDPADRPDSVIEATRGKHSEKPDIVYDLIETAMPDRTYLELFARTERDGWTSWGNEV